MNMLSTLFAIAFSSANPSPVNCAAYVLTDPACEQTLRLSAYQQRQVALIRAQTSRSVASLNLKLRPRLWRELKPGTRIVSHDFDMGNWEPEEEVQMNGSTVYLWTIPPDAASRVTE